VNTAFHGGYSASCFRVLPAKPAPLYRQLPFQATSRHWVLTWFHIALVSFGPQVLVLPPRNLTLNTWGLAFWLPSLAWSSLAKPFPSCHCLIIAARSRWCAMCHTQWPFATTHTGHMLTMSPGTPYLIYTLLDIVIGRFLSTRMIPAKSRLTSTRNLYNKIHI